MFRALVTYKPGQQKQTSKQKQQQQQQAISASVPNLKKYFQPQSNINPGSPQQPITIDLEDEELSTTSGSDPSNKFIGILLKILLIKLTRT